MTGGVLAKTIVAHPTAIFNERCHYNDTLPLHKGTQFADARDATQPGNATPANKQ